MKKHLFGFPPLLWIILTLYSIQSGGDQSYLKFDLKENGGIPLSQTLSYELKNGHLIRLGELDFDLDRIAPSFGPEIEAASALYALRFAWPNKSALNGDLSIRDYDSNETIYQTPLSLIETSSSFKHVSAPEEQIPLNTILSKKGERNLKFCIENRNQSLHTVLCSRPYIVLLKKKDYIFFETGKKYLPNVVANGNPASLSGHQELLRDRPSVIVIQSQNGSTIKIEVSPIPSSFDSVFVNKYNHLIIEGHGISPSKNILAADSSGWRAEMNLQDPNLYFLEPNGFFITQPFKFTRRVPPEESRTYLDPESINETYSNHVLLHGHTTMGITASSEHLKVTMAPESKFHWDFQSEQEHQDNEQKIIFTEGNKGAFTGSYVVYRGLPYEVSANIAAASSDAYTVPVFGELTGTGWLEQVFKSENPTWSLHRWGAHINALTTIINASNLHAHQVGFSDFEADVRYTLIPGLWSKNEMYGPLINYQMVSFNAASGALMGIGAFWSRQLPNGLSSFLEGLSWFRYPKWFELQGNYYLISGNSSTAISTNFDLLANLKIFFRPTLFAKLALEYRYFNFVDQTQQVSVQTSPFLVSAGLGLNF